MKRKQARTRRTAGKAASGDIKAVQPDVPTLVPEGRRGRRSMPAVRAARSRYAKVQREVAGHEKAVRTYTLELAVAGGRGHKAKSKAAIRTAAAALRKARSNLKKIAAELRQVLADEAARSRALAQERALALYKLKLEVKLGKDLDKALARFASVWKKKRNKIVSRKLAARAKKEAEKSRAASRKANAKARESLERAEALAKARARKAEARVRAKAGKLAAMMKAKARLAVRKATRRTRLAAVGTRKVLRKRSK